MRRFARATLAAAIAWIAEVGPPTPACEAAAPRASVATPGEARAAWRAWTLAYRPDLAVREGARWPARPLPLDEARIDRARVALDELGAAIARVPRDQRSPAERTLLDTLDARIAREAALFARDAWRQEPMLYAVTTLEAALDAAAAGKRVSACERSGRAIGPLRATPEALRAAEVNLREARAFDAAATLARWDGAMRRARTELPATFLECRDGRRLADAVEADTLALAAAERFRRFLRERLVQSARTP